MATMSYMAERCGAWQAGDDADAGVIEFRVFFPAGADNGIDALEVVGTFAESGAPPLAMTRDASDLGESSGRRARRSQCLRGSMNTLTTSASRTVRSAG